MTYTTDPLYVQGKIIEIGKKKLVVVQKPTKSNRGGFDYIVLVNMVQTP